MINEYIPENDAWKHPNWLVAPEGRKYSIKQLFEEIDMYAALRPELSDALIVRMKLQYLKSYHKYQGNWEEWSAERHRMEGLDELADFHNYQIFEGIVDDKGFNPRSTE